MGRIGVTPPAAPAVATAAPAVATAAPAVAAAGPHAAPVEGVDRIRVLLGHSLFSEELKGDFAAASAAAEELLGEAVNGTGVADALIAAAAIGVMQGQPSAADGLVERVAEQAPGDPLRRLRALTWTVAAATRRYNTFPDGNGVMAVEVNARWGIDEFTVLDGEWRAALAACADARARLEASMVGVFLTQLQSLRSTFESGRFLPLPVPRDQLLAMARANGEQLRGTGDGSAANAAGFAEWTTADLCRRSGDEGEAKSHLLLSYRAYRDAGDTVGEALCLMTALDWDLAPFSHPLAWNFAIADSSSQGSALAEQVESVERTAGTAIDGSYDEAFELFRSAGATRGVAHVELRRGFIAALADDWATAAACAWRARELSVSCGDRRSEHLAATHLLLCQIAGAGRPDLDVPALARGVGEWGAASGSFADALGLGILINRAGRDWYLRRGHFERSLACAQAAHALFDALGADINAAQSLVDRGAIHRAAGEQTLASTFLVQALQRYEAAIERWPRVADNLRSRATFVASDVYELASQRRDSDGMERAARRLAAELPRIEFQPIRQLAESHVIQCSVLAPTYRARAARKRGDSAEEARQLDLATAALASVPDADRPFLEAMVLAQRRDFAGAADAMERHLAAGGANAGFVGELTQVMVTFGGAFGAAQAALQQRRSHEQGFAAFVRVRAYEKARQHWQALVSLAGEEWWRSDPRPWLPLSDAAEMLERVGDYAQAMPLYDQAIAELEARRNSLSRDELKVAMASDQGAQYLYFLAARAAVASGDAGRGFSYAERGKARALLDLMAAAQPDGAATDPALQAWREAGVSVRQCRTLLARAHEQVPADEARIRQIEQRVTDWEHALADAEQALARSNPRFHEVVAKSAALLGSDDVARRLAPGTLLIEYFFLDQDLLAWAVPSGGEVIAHKAETDIDALNLRIRAFHAACRDGDLYEDAARALSAVLLQPFADAIRASRALIVVPHGASHVLPFHALPFDGLPLASARSVSYLPSASTLQFLETTAPSGIPEQILVVGNPTGDLPSARTEAEAVARLFAEPVLLLGEAATEDAVRQRVGSMPMVHLATHGSLDDEVPLNSSIALAGGEALTVYELMQLRLRARLVVLSACSTAEGEATGGDDVLGLTRGLLAAGARAAIVSLWPVDDESTALLMETLYTALRAGASPAAGLLAAQSAVRARGGSYEHPYHWAPFVLVG